MAMLHSVFAKTGGIAIGVLMLLLLAACGGGGSSSLSPQLPQTLNVTAPTSQQALNATIAFSSNTADPANALTYQWDFGDGTTSTLANPSHGYARPGVYTVRLTVSDGTGATVSATSAVSVADLAIAQGKVCSGADLTGWCWQRPLPQGNVILDYTFVNDVQGWAVGEAGTVLTTSDAGVTWRPQVSGTELALTKVVFKNAQAGWVAGTNGELLKTADGGATWRAVSFGLNETVQLLGVSDADVAWVTTNFGNTLLTIDGGSTWKRITGPVGSFSRIVVTSATNILALSFTFPAPTLARSLDGGLTWSGVSLPPLEAGLSRVNVDMQVRDASHALLTASEFGFSSATQNFISRQVAWTTADGGATWQVLNPPSANTFFNLSLADANTVFAQGFSGSAVLQSTNNGGATWQTVALPVITDSFFASYQAYSARRLIVRDGLGRAYLTTDGGAHWAVRNAGGTFLPPLNNVWFFNAREGLAVGSDGSSVRTTDGGQNWVTTTPNGFFGWRRAQFLPGGGIGWVISDSGSIYRSTDKGATWLSPVPQTSAVLNSVSDFHFVDELRGWAVTSFVFPGHGAFYRSVDGGLSWQSIAGTDNFVGLTALRFADATHGVAVGAAGVALVTADGGATWSPRPTGIDRNLRRVTFIDTNTAVAVGEGGVIVRSTDQGRTWAKRASPTPNALNDVRFVSATTGYAVGELGTVLATRDGGLSWTVLGTGVRANLQAVYFVDEQTGWIVGDNGNILATVSGGR